MVLFSSSEVSHSNLYDRNGSVIFATVELGSINSFQIFDGNANATSMQASARLGQMDEFQGVVPSEGRSGYSNGQCRTASHTRHFEPQKAVKPKMLKTDRGAQSPRTSFGHDILRGHDLH